MGLSAKTHKLHGGQGLDYQKPTSQFLQIRFCRRALIQRGNREEYDKSDGGPQ